MDDDGGNDDEVFSNENSLSHLPLNSHSSTLFIPHTIYCLWSPLSLKVSALGPTTSRECSGSPHVL